MSKFIDNFLKVGVIGAAAVSIVAGIGELIEDNRREGFIDSVFSGEIKQPQFEQMCVEEAKKIKRLWVDVDGPKVKGTVKSQSGLSEWHFTLDFNDFGRLTGKCWKTTDNNQSQIPECLESRIRQRILDYSTC